MFTTWGVVAIVICCVGVTFFGFGMARWSGGKHLPPTRAQQKISIS
jgi:hypothetical protein